MIRRPPRSTLFPYTNALPIYGSILAEGAFDLARIARDGERQRQQDARLLRRQVVRRDEARLPQPRGGEDAAAAGRSEEHTSELQSRQYLVCRLLLEKKKTEST